MSDQITDRKAKLEKIRALGVDPYGGRFTAITVNAAIRAAADTLNIEAGQICEQPQARFRAAGRVVLFRDIGSLIFMTIRDRTGDLQFGLSKKMVQGLTDALSHSAALDPTAAHRPPSQGGLQGGTGSTSAGAATLAQPLPEREGIKELTAPELVWKLAKLIDLGDIVAAEGRLGRTKTGELTLWTDRFSILSKAVRPPPEKWHGLTDVEARYRRRYVDLFANPESRDIFVTRARIIAHVRKVLAERNFIEVETPVLQPIYGGAAARPFMTHHNTLDMDLYLRISPELYLKRCLVGGLERVYEFARCFRNEGISPRHNPEFTMLELYQAYGDYHDMMDITEAIIAGAARDVIGSTKIQFGDREIDYATPWPRRRYADLVREYAGVDIDDHAAVLQKARDIGLLGKIERAAAAAVAATAAATATATAAPTADNRPPSQGGLQGGTGSAGASASTLPQPLPEREGSAGPVQIDHVLLVNALFEETVEHNLINPTFVIDYPAPLCPLTRRDPHDPRYALRFEVFLNGMEMGNAYSELNDPEIQRENLTAQVEGEGDETMRVMDDDFVEALEHAMPPAGGLGIGIDRLVMLLTGSQSIRDVLLFPLQRPQA